MNAHHAPNRSVVATYWLWLERLSHRVSRAARRRSSHEEIAFAEPTKRHLGSHGLMQMLDAMPSWSFSPLDRAFITRTAASSSASPVVVTPKELRELIGALDRLRPGPIWLGLVGLNWDQMAEVRKRLHPDSTVTVSHPCETNLRHS